MLKAILLVLILILAWYGNRQYQHKKFMQEVQAEITQENTEKIKETQPQPKVVTPVQPKKVTVIPKKAVPKFHCDGRKHCSQMYSYEEAKFFSDHCPDTRMDGDNDGIPCERQFNR